MSKREQELMVENEQLREALVNLGSPESGDYLLVDMHRQCDVLRRRLQQEIAETRKLREALTPLVSKVHEFNPIPGYTPPRLVQVVLEDLRRAKEALG